MSPRLLSAALAAGLLLSGCQSRSPHAIPTVSVRTAAFVPSAAAQVQSSPLYKQARQDCKRKDFRQAADHLQTLSRTPGLAPDAVAFCNAQRDICLKDAGLAPVSMTVAVASLPARTPADADCGPRALLLVCRKLGVKTDLQTLQQAAGTTSTGTTLAGLQQAAQKLGLQAEGVQVSREALPDIATPAIGWFHRNHYEVLLALSGSGDKATAVLHDPNKPNEETISQEQLLQRCNGYLLLVHR